MRYAVVLGYGLFDKSDANYKGYVDNFVGFANRNKIDAIVLSGGHTNPKRKSESEASTIECYIRPKLKRRTRIILEDRSISTDQNIDFVGKIVHVGKGDEVIVFCDNIRPPRVMWFILHYWFGLSAGKIERYFIDIAVKHYKKGHTNKEIGREMTKGMKYGKVRIIAYPLRTGIEEAVSNQVATTMDILSLYDKELHEILNEATRIKHGI
jgi:hypothetical protein